MSNSEKNSSKRKTPSWNQELFEWERGERVRLTPEESEERYRQYREADIVLQLLDELDGCEKNAASKGRKTKRQKQAKSKPSKRKNAHRAPHQENATIEGNPAPSQSASGPEFVGAFARLGLRAHPQTMPQGNELN